ncbi:MAG: thiamine biosynthesis protein ApbE [Planctomycetaceae bacterium]|nr:thiamine biosynthesis protein ApbE [Planctomycetaceae bacterium]
MRQVGRRRFLCLVAGATASAGFASSLLLRDRRQPGAAELQRVERTSWALGSDVSIVALHKVEAVAKTGIDAAFAELELVEGLMSIYRPGSQLSQLNRNGILNNPHPYFVKVLQAVRNMSERTDGAFDVTIQPLWDLYAQAKKRGELPSQLEIETTQNHVDWRNVEASKSQVHFRREGTAITLNGIAQGFAADRVATTLCAHGIEHALIDTGEIGSLGAKSDGDRWKIGIQHPRKSDAYLSLAELAGRCLATSGDYATTFSPDFKHHHLLDPRTGYSPSELSSVSIAANSALEADALSTAVFVMGAESGMDLVRETPSIDAMFVLKDGRVRTTNGFPANT